MFEIPDAKRVRRTDLYTSDRSDSSEDEGEDELPDAESAQLLRDRLAAIYGTLPELTRSPTPPEDKDIHGPPGRGKDKEEEGFEFRLFSGTGHARKDSGDGWLNGDADEGGEKVHAQRIVLGDEDEEWGDGAFTVPQRSLRYYISEKAEGERKLGFEMMAMEGEEILKGKEKRAWGLEVPWRVKVLRVQNTKKIKASIGGGEKIIALPLDGEGKEGKKSKPGKKRRILLRKRDQVKKKKEEEKRAKLQGKEEYKKEKRARLNRTKKIKRRTKEKAEKEAKKNGGVGVGSGGGDGAAGESDKGQKHESIQNLEEASAISIDR